MNIINMPIGIGNYEFVSRFSYIHTCIYTELELCNRRNCKFSNITLLFVIGCLSFLSRLTDWVVSSPLVTVEWRVYHLWFTYSLCIGHITQQSFFIWERFLSCPGFYILISYILYDCALYLPLPLPLPLPPSPSPPPPPPYPYPYPY